MAGRVADTAEERKGEYNNKHTNRKISHFLIYIQRNKIVEIKKKKWGRSWKNAWKNYQESGKEGKWSKGRNNKGDIFMSVWV